MGKLWLGSLPQVLADAGLDVLTYAGWETRSRSTGGYEKLLGIQVHHTASRTTPARDMEWMWRNAPAKPIGALYLDRSGTWTVGAAGATNTSGRGGPMVASNGTVPKNQGNLYWLSIEAANDGRGERWPDAQLWSYVIGVAALCRAYGLNPHVRGDVHGHFEWTPRKVDPAGESWYAIGSSSWNMTKFRNDVGSVPATIPPEVDMDATLYRVVTFPKLEPGAYLVGPTGVVHLDAFFRDLYLHKGVASHISDNADFLASCRYVARGK